MDAGSSSNAYSLSQATQDNMKVVLGSLVGKNPYRILGVYANATSKEMQKNLSRISAFAKVGRSEGFPTDFSAAFRVASALMRVEFEAAVFEPRRDEAAVAAAQAQLHSAGDRLVHLCFWWTCATPADEAAFRKLETGDLEGAREIWNRRSNVSAVVNAMTTSWLLADTATVGAKAEELFCTMGDELCALVDPTLRLEPEALIRRFFVALTDVGCRVETLPQGTHEVWRRLWSEYAAVPYLRAIEKEVAAAASLGDVPAENLQAAKRLKTLAVRVLPQLKKIYADDVLAYQVQADKLAEAVLQRAIVFFNESGGGEAVYQAMPLQQYALSIAEGEPARQRCRENVAVLQGWVDDLSPQTVKQHLDRVISPPVGSAPMAAASAGTTASAPRQVESPHAQSAAFAPSGQTPQTAGPQAKPEDKAMKDWGCIPRQVESSQAQSTASAPAATSAPSGQTSQTAVPQAKPEEKEMSDWGCVLWFLFTWLVLPVCVFVASFFIAKEFFPENRNAPWIICLVFYGVWILGSAIHSYFTEGLSNAIKYLLIVGGIAGLIIGLSMGIGYIGYHFFDGSLLVPPIAYAIVGLIIGGILALRESDKEDKIGALWGCTIAGAVYGGVMIGVGKLIELILDFLK